MRNATAHEESALSARKLSAVAWVEARQPRGEPGPPPLASSSVSTTAPLKLA